MLISHSRPTDATFTASGGTIETDPSALVNGRPGSVTRCTWTDPNAMFGLQATWSGAFAPRVLGVIGTTLPAGTLFDYSLRRPSDPGFAYYPLPCDQYATELPHGGRVAWFVLPPGLDPCIAVQFEFYSDAASMAAGTTFELGEIWFGPGDVWPIEPGWDDRVDDPSVLHVSPDGQPWVRPKTPRRVLTVTPAVTQQAAVFGGDAARRDAELLTARLTRGQSCVAIPRWLDDAARTAIFGYATHLPTPRHTAGPWFSFDPLTITEAPIPA